MSHQVDSEFDLLDWWGTRVTMKGGEEASFKSLSHYLLPVFFPLISWNILLQFPQPYWSRFFMATLAVGQKKRYMGGDSGATGKWSEFSAKEERSWTDACSGNEGINSVEYSLKTRRVFPQVRSQGLENNPSQERGSKTSPQVCVSEQVSTSDTRSICTQWKVGKKIGTAVWLLQIFLA